MRNFIIRTILFLVPALCYSSTTEALTRPVDADTGTFSLLTCAPGEQIYTLFGHTAIRYQDPAEDIDIVYNYGLFSFDAPNFVWRFVKGETDYYLGVTSYTRFLGEYDYYNRAVWEQVLNLTVEEKNQLLQLLEENFRPENRMYRYNFFYDNCSTRPRDIIEASIQGKVVYQDTDSDKTFRDIVHESAVGYDWSRFGMDFCLGADADKLITYRQEMFAPFYLMKAYDDARIINNDDTERPLVTETTQLLFPKAPGQSGSYLMTPLRTFLLLFILIAALTIYGIKKQKSLWGVDMVLFAAFGLAGCIVTLLTFFSEHPTVSPNWLIFVFHPIHLLAIPFIVHSEIKRKRSIYHVANAIILTLFILLWPLNPQYFNPAILPLALCLLVRSMSNLVLTYKPKVK